MGSASDADRPAFGSDGQAICGTPEGSAESCCLPALTRFTGLGCTGPDRHIPKRDVVRILCQISKSASVVACHGGRASGGVRERPNRHAWKACDLQGSVGSNPTPSAQPSAEIPSEEAGNRPVLGGRIGGRASSRRPRLPVQPGHGSGHGSDLLRVASGLRPTGARSARPGRGGAQRPEQPDARHLRVEPGLRFSSTRTPPSRPGPAPFRAPVGSRGGPRQNRRCLRSSNAGRWRTAGSPRWARGR